MLHKKGKNFEKVFGNFGKKIFFSEKMFLRNTFFSKNIDFPKIDYLGLKNFCLKRFFFPKNKEK